MTTFTRGARSKLTKILLGVSMPIFMSACAPGQTIQGALDNPLGTVLGMGRYVSGGDMGGSEKIGPGNTPPQDNTKNQNVQDILPLAFFIKDGPGYTYSVEGTSKIIYPDQPRFEIVGREKLFFMGGEVTNRVIDLDSEKKGRIVKKSYTGADNGCKFNYTKLFIEMEREGEPIKRLANVWYVDGVEKARVYFTLVHPEVMKRANSKNSGRDSNNELVNKSEVLEKEKKDKPSKDNFDSFILNSK